MPDTRLSSTKRILLKVKNGCITCKYVQLFFRRQTWLICRSRRVKCDERKPHCQKCTRFGRKCGGYPSSIRENPKVEVLVLGPPTRSKNLPGTTAPGLLRQPIEAIPLSNEKEARFFRIFQEQVRRELAGAFNLSLWDRLVLQVCRDEPFARHAVVALGALKLAHKARSLQSKADSVSNFGDPEEHHAFALTQYERALKYMRTTISDPNGDLWKALLSCLLVFCFESFLGRKDLAILQAQSGQKLFQDRIISRIVSKERGCVLDIDIVHAFARLDLHLMTALDTRSSTMHSSFTHENCTILSQMPSIFKNIVTAKVYLELLMQKIGHLLASALDFAGPSDQFEELEDVQKMRTEIDFGLSIYFYQRRVISPAFRLQHKQRTADLERWAATFEHLAHEKDVSDEITDGWLAMARLQVHSRILRILLAAALFTSEVSYDDYLPDFQAIVSYALPIIEHEAEISEARFDFDVSIIAPLGFVVTKCRDWKVRREALRMLGIKTVKREVFWDGKILEAPARTLMETEEEGLRFGEAIPEDRRASILSVGKDEGNNCATVKFLIGKASTGGRGVISTKLIRW